MKSTEGQQTWTCNVKVSPFSFAFTSAVFRRHSPERLVAWKNRFPSRGADQILVPTFIVDLLFCVEQRFPSRFSRSFNSFIHIMLHCTPWHCATPRGAAPQHADLFLRETVLSTASVTLCRFHGPSWSVCETKTSSQGAALLLLRR